jgi:hypothetical protein
VSDREPWRIESLSGESLSRSVDLPPEIDISVPSVARGYDYALGGKNNFEVDRIAGDALIDVFPGILALARDNRAFLRRGVRSPVTRDRSSTTPPPAS